MGQEGQVEPSARRAGPVVARMLRDGAAVLAAILAAFALDAWWSANSERQRADALLLAIRGEFTGAAAQLDSIVQVNDGAILHLSVFTDRAANGAPPIPRDSLRALVQTPAEWFQLYEPSFGGLTTLISSGGLEQVRDLELQQALGSWFGEVEDLNFEERQIEFAVQKVFSAAASVSALPSPVALESGEIGIATLERRALSVEYQQACALLALVLADYQRDLIRLRQRAALVADQLQK